MWKVFEIIESTSLPDGVANYVTGRGSDIGTSLTTHEAVDAVSFTGSISVGRIVYNNATDDQKRIQAEMGREESDRSDAQCGSPKSGRDRCCQCLRRY